MISTKETLLHNLKLAWKKIPAGLCWKRFRTMFAEGKICYFYFIFSTAWWQNDASYESRERTKMLDSCGRCSEDRIRTAVFEAFKKYFWHNRLNIMHDELESIFKLISNMRRYGKYFHIKFQAWRMWSNNSRFWCPTKYLPCDKLRAKTW